MNRKQFKEKFIKSGLFICAGFSIIVVLSIIGYLFFMGYPDIITLALHGVYSFAATGIGNGHTLASAIGATFYIATGATALAVLVGLPCAIYLAEFSDMKLRNFTKTSLEVLDGFPSIIIGIIGWDLLVLPVQPGEKASSYAFTFNAFLIKLGAGGSGCDLLAWLLLLIMSFPIIATLSEDALRAVPQDLREASLGVGATKWQTTKEVLIPSAMPRIITSCLLALAAAMGEVVAISFVLSGTLTLGLYNNPLLIFNPLVEAQPLSVLMETSYSSTLDSVARPGPGVYAVGFILFVIIGVVNIVARRVVANQNKTLRE